jgi:C4-dicarboxylate-specific signal transduction histidine kinase
MLGQLAASIAHEVNQPLAAIVTNGEAGLRWHDRDTPDLDEVRRTVERIIKDGARAAEMIRRVRALSHKTDIDKVPLDINSVVNEVIALVQRELFHPPGAAQDGALALAAHGPCRSRPASAGDHQSGDERYRSHAAGRRRAIF